jgi:nicotinamidase-related amidase
LVLIDVQRDFYVDDAPLRIEGTGALISAMAKLAKAFRERSLPIVHVVRLYRPDGSNVDLVRRKIIEQGARIAVPGSAGSQIAADLLPNVPMFLSWNTNCCWPAACSKSGLPSM